MEREKEDIRKGEKAKETENQRGKKSKRRKRENTQ